MKKKFSIITFLIILLSFFTFAQADDIYNNERGIKVKADVVGGIAIPGVKIVTGDDNTDGGYLKSADGKLLVADTGFLHEVMSGNVANHNYIKIKGHSHSVGTSEQELSALGTADFGNWPAAAAGVVLVSTDVDDDGDPADTGARTVTVSGLDANWAEQEVTITMNGTTPTTVTAETFIRIHELEVATAGTSLTNEGVITASISGTNIIRTYAEHSTSESGRYTVPAGKEAHFQNAEASNVGNKATTYHVFCRDNAVPNAPFQLRLSWHSSEGGFRPNGLLPIFTEKVDILIQTHAELAGAKASGSIEGFYRTVP